MWVGSRCMSCGHLPSAFFVRTPEVQLGQSCVSSGAGGMARECDMRDRKTQEVRGGSDGLVWSDSQACHVYRHRRTGGAASCIGGRTQFHPTRFHSCCGCRRRGGIIRTAAPASGVPPPAALSVLPAHVRPSRPYPPPCASCPAAERGGPAGEG